MPRRRARGQPLLTSGLQLAGVFCFVGVVFTSGLVIGVKFFHAHEGAMLDAGGLHSFTHNTLEASPHLRGQAGADAAASTPGSPPDQGTQSLNSQVPTPGAPTRGTPLSGGSLVSLPEPYDGHAVTVTAWIRLDGANKDPEMKTVAANRWAGCSPTAGRYGFALYVNDWGTHNRQLRVVLGNARDGCVAVFTAQEAIPYDEWTHVALSLGPPGPSSPVALFVNGRRAAGGTHAREAQTMDPLRIGAHSDGEAGFVGSISAVAVYGAQRTEEQIAAEVSHGVPAGDAALLAHFPLDGLSSDHATEAAAAAAAGSGSGPVVARYYPNHDSYLAEHPRVQAALPSAAGAMPPAVGSESDPADRMDIPFDQIVAGTWDHTAVTDEQRTKSDELGRERAEQVKTMVKRSWAAYRDKAWGKDEVLPRSGRGRDNWAGLAVTMVDTLDTLWIMGLKEEFQEARDWIEQHLHFNKHATVSVFETTIRVLGGLLSAYDLSKDTMFLDKAKDLGDRLLRAFDTESGIPMASVNLETGSGHSPGWAGGSVLAELGTLQVELRYLSRHTGNPVYRQKAEQVHKVLKKSNPPDGLFPIFIRPRDGGLASQKVTFGALGDSFYEYLLKMWIQGGGEESVLKDMYTRAVAGMTHRLLKRSSPSKLLYVADAEGHRVVDKMDHLVCFVSGMLALGAHTMPESQTREQDMAAAKALAYTCYQMYRRQPTGLSPEYVRFEQGKDLQVPGNAPFYILRPEAVESFFYLNQLTGHPVFREWGWSVFQAIERHCRTELAYGAHPDVRNPERPPDDRMESFFLAETAKYLYLLFSPDHSISLDKYVFNTEAHPLTVFPQDGKEKWEPDPELVNL